LSKSRDALDRLSDWIETGAAAMLAAVTAITFVAVFLRYLFGTSIPDTFDFGRNFLGILIFWGIGVAGYRGDHIAVDLLWSAAGRGGRRAIELFAETVTLFCLGAFVWMQADKVLQTQASGLSTYDLRLPVWTFYAVAWIGLGAGLILAVARFFRILSGKEPSATPTTPAMRD